MNKKKLKDDLIKLDYHINEIIDNLICSGKDKEFKKCNSMGEILQVVFDFVVRNYESVNLYLIK